VNRTDSSLPSHISLVDLARHLDLSVGTVSRALNGHSKVRNATRQRVLLAAREIGYVPNPLARGLSSGKSGLVGVLFSHFNNLISGVFLIRLLKLLEAHGKRALIKVANPITEESHDIIRHFTLMRVEGVLVIGPSLEQCHQTLEPLAGRQIPFSLLNLGGPASLHLSVQYDRSLVNEKLVLHLMEQGHQRLALIGFDPKAFSFQARLEGIARAYKARRLDADRYVDQYSLPREKQETTFAYGSRMAARLLECGSLATACIAANDELALGAIQRFHAAGIRVPDEMSVAGFDNLSFSSYATPGITSIDLDVDRALELTFNMLIRQMEDPDGPPPASVTLEPTLILRESTGPARRTKGLRERRDG